MEKKLIRKVSDWWGEYDCSSNRNMPKYIRWLSRETQDDYKVSVYVDNYIQHWGFNDPSREKIGWLLESPQMNEGTIKYLVDNLEMTREHYKWIFTCMDSLLELGAPFVYNISNAAPWIYPQNRMIHPKTKLVSMIASNKGWLRGHQNRLQWVDKLKDKVELYGTGRPNQLKDKEDGLKDYMFSVAIENKSFMGYFSEKIQDCFATGTIPIYHGAPDIGKFFNPNGIITLTDDFDVSSLTPELYYDKMDAVKENFEIVQNSLIVDDYLYKTFLEN